MVLLRRCPDLYYYSPDDIGRRGEFQYEDLNLTGPSTRLVVLLKAKKSDYSGNGYRFIPRIKCELDVAYIGDHSKIYAAVSYAWGPDSRDRVIQLSGRKFKVSRVVEDILLRLRREDEDVVLWIDQICINQGNKMEKAVQVKRMNDIFGAAQKVIASLGPHRGPVMDERYDNGRLAQPGDPKPRVADSHRAQFDRLSQLLSTKQEAMDCVQSRGRILPLSKRDEQTLVTLLELPWFQRVWVIQKVAVAKDLIVICGDREVNGSQFKNLYNSRLSRVRDPRLKKMVHDVRPLLEFFSKKDTNTEMKPELLWLLQTFRSWKAQDPRDKVYALLGLSDDFKHRDNQLLMPDYTVPVDELFERVTYHMLARHGSLAVITYAIQPGGQSARQIERAILAAAPTQPKVQTQSWSEWCWSRLFGAPQHIQLPPIPPAYPTNALMIPSWCPDWSKPYIYDVDPEPVTRFQRWINRYPPLEINEIVANPGTSGILRIEGLVVATVKAVLDRGFDVSIALGMKPFVKNMPATCTEISQYLRKVTNGFHGRPFGSLRHGDCLCLLDDCTGLAILRPDHEWVRLVLLEHSKFHRANFTCPILLPSQQQLFGIDTSDICADIGDERLRIDNVTASALNPHPRPSNGSYYQANLGRKRRAGIFHTFEII